MVYFPDPKSDIGKILLTQRAYMSLTSYLPLPNKHNALELLDHFILPVLTKLKEKKKKPQFLQQNLPFFTIKYLTDIIIWLKTEWFYIYTNPFNFYIKR